VLNLSPHHRHNAAFVNLKIAIVRSTWRESGLCIAVEVDRALRRRRPARLCKRLGRWGLGKKTFRMKTTVTIQATLGRCLPAFSSFRSTLFSANIPLNTWAACAPDAVHQGTELGRLFDTFRRRQIGSVGCVEDHERNHQGMGNRLVIEEEPRTDKTGVVQCHHRLGARLNHVDREAA
jgi:hypothetical protein